VLFRSLAVVAAAPWMLWFAASTHHALPATIGAKRMFFAEGCLPAAVKREWTLTAVGEFVAALGVAARALPFLLLTRLGWASAGFLAALVGAYYVNFPGALGHYENRYLYVAVPVLLYGLASALAHRARWLRVAATVLLLLAVEQSAWEIPARWTLHMNNRRFTSGELDDLATWCRRNLPADAVLLVHDAGYIAAATRFRLVDIVGLKTPSSMEYHARLTWPSCGRDRAEAVHRIALAQRPGYLVALRGWDRIYRLSEGLRLRGWRLEPLRGHDRPYEVFRLTPPANADRKSTRLNSSHRYISRMPSSA
jgi:hypothetical protein